MGVYTPIFPFLVMNPSTDLLKRCCKDDRKAHYELYNMCYGFLVSVCRRYYVNTEDVVSALNMTFLKAIKNMAVYIKDKTDVPFELWIRRIAINHIIDEFRKNKSYKQQIELITFEEAEYLHPSVDPVIAERGRMEDIMEAVNQLPAASKTVFNLYVVDGYQHDEIAGMLNISTSTSKAHLFKARKKLQEILGKNKGEKNQMLIQYR